MFTETEYRERLKEYTDSDGLVCQKKVNQGERGASGNGLLYTSIGMINLTRNRWLKESDVIYFRDVLLACSVPNYPYLFNRSPVKTDMNSHDDYTGIAAAFYEMGLDFMAASLLKNFIKRSWHCDNETPEKPKLGAYLCRFPAFVNHIYNCANQEAPKFTSTIAELGMRFASYTTKKDDGDGWLLGYLRAFSSKSKESTLFINKLKSTFSDGGQGIVSRVLNEDLAHPLGLVFKI